jgi:hypothetical protein
MSDSVEDLLAQVKSKYVKDEQVPSAQPALSAEVTSNSLSDALSSSHQSFPSQSSSRQSSPSQSSSVPSPADSSSANSINDLLISLQTQPSPPQAKPSQTKSSTSLNFPTTFPNPIAPNSAPSDPSTDPLLAQLKAEYTEQDRQAKEEEQQRLQQEQQQQRAALVRRAQAWLKSLDPHGGEGVWFEQFSAKYESRLEAAIDYLGVEDSQPNR